MNASAPSTTTPPQALPAPDFSDWLSPILVKELRQGLKSRAFVAIFILVCEHVIPTLIVRRNPERVLEVLLPPFDAIARTVRPITSALTRLIAEPRRERTEQVEPVEVETAPAGGPTEAEPSEEQGLIEEEGRKLLQSIVDFGDTLVREVMTPRPDMVAISADATLEELLALLREQESTNV